MGMLNTGEHLSGLKPDDLKGSSTVSQGEGVIQSADKTEHMVSAYLKRSSWSNKPYGSALVLSFHKRGRQAAAAALVPIAVRGGRWVGQA